jgi:hypothetical protein
MFVEVEEKVVEVLDYHELYQAVYDENFKVMTKFFDKGYVPSQLVNLLSHSRSKQTVNFVLFEPLEISDCKSAFLKHKRE